MYRFSVWFCISRKNNDIYFVSLSFSSCRGKEERTHPSHVVSIKLVHQNSLDAGKVYRFDETLASLTQDPVKIADNCFSHSGENSKPQESNRKPTSEASRETPFPGVQQWHNVLRQLCFPLHKCKSGKCKAGSLLQN